MDSPLPIADVSKYRKYFANTELFNPRGAATVKG
jgi:hypothetical protein